MYWNTHTHTRKTQSYTIYARQIYWRQYIRIMKNRRYFLSLDRTYNTRTYVWVKHIFRWISRIPICGNIYACSHVFHQFSLFASKYKRGIKAKIALGALKAFFSIKIKAENGRDGSLFFIIILKNYWFWNGF